MKQMKKKLVSLLRNLFKEEESEHQAQETVKINVFVVNDDGTPELNNEEYTVSKQDDEEELELLEKMLKKALFGEEEKKKETPKNYILNSREDQWFYAPNARSMVRIPGGSQLVVTDPTPNDDGKILCYCDFGFILVPMEDISPLGYN